MILQVAQALAKVGTAVGVDEVMPCLQRLLKDTDSDVRFYAAEAIECLTQNNGTEDKMETTESAPSEPVVLATA